MKSLKTIILIAAMGIISYTTKGQKANNIPPAVLTAFSAKYPQAQLKHWKIKNNVCTASFAAANKKYIASYSADGTWISTVRNIRHVSSLPDQARMFLKKSYASWHIDNMERLRTPSQNVYQVEIDNDSGNKMHYEDAGSFEDYLLCFNDEGKLIKKIDNY